MEYSSFFDDINDDRLYDAEQFANYFRKFLSTGVYHTNNAPALLVKAGTGLQTILEPGSAFLQGYMYENTEDILFTHDIANNTNPRIDRIVIRLDRNLNNRDIRAFVKTGTPSTNPVPPALQRDILVYEISLAQVLINAGSTNISKVTDERLNTSVSGIVHSLISIPTEQFEAEWRTWFGKIQVQNPAMGGMTITVSPTAPVNPTTNDIWIDTK